jgi:hypothetical protein
VKSCELAHKRRATAISPGSRAARTYRDYFSAPLTQQGYPRKRAQSMHYNPEWVCDSNPVDPLPPYHLMSAATRVVASSLQCI